MIKGGKGSSGVDREVMIRGKAWRGEGWKDRVVWPT